MSTDPAAPAYADFTAALAAWRAADPATRGPVPQYGEPTKEPSKRDKTAPKPTTKPAPKTAK